MPEIERTVVSVIPVNPAGQVLLQQRDDRPDLLYPGQWTFFGGAAESGETPGQAISREIAEELGAELQTTFWMHYVCPARTVPGEVTTTNYVYFAVVDPSVTSLTLGEGQAMEWMDRERALSLDLAFQQSDILRQFFEAGLNTFGQPS
jgi:8-oxo-dGTP diphosphatase